MKILTTQDAIKARIFELRAKQNLKISQLAKKATLDESTVRSIFNGKSKNTGIVTIKNICDGLGISLQEFFDCELFMQILDD